MKRKGSIFIIIGIVLLVSAAFLTGKNLIENERANKNAEEILDKLIPEVIEKNEERINVPDALFTDTDVYREMPVKTIDGREYVAIISIPSLNIDLPVFSEWDYDKLSYAPCRFSGSVYTKDLVICAHNYTGHFGPIDNLRLGDKVIVIDMDGNYFNYSVVEVETLDPSSVDEMISGDSWDLTLFTCTLSGATRITVRCTLEK